MANATGRRPPTGCHARWRCLRLRHPPAAAPEGRPCSRVNARLTVAAPTLPATTTKPHWSDGPDRHPCRQPIRHRNRLATTLVSSSATFLNCSSALNAVPMAMNRLTSKESSCGSTTSVLASPCRRRLRRRIARRTASCRFPARPSPARCRPSRCRILEPSRVGAASPPVRFAGQRSAGAAPFRSEGQVPATISVHGRHPSSATRLPPGGLEGPSGRPRASIEHHHPAQLRVR